YNGYEIKVSNKLFYAYNEAFAPISCLQTLDCYNGLPSGKKIMFKGDERYLFRATTDNDLHDGNAIKKVIQRFNNFIPSNEKKSIVFRVLNKNRIFLNLYNNENDKNNDSNASLIHRIISTLGCDRTTAYTCLGQYQNFVTMLENNKL
ncbi:MAG: hypothetical protein K2H24_02175, partial [Clostridia bacterium]|nr:hypothetical protein [Clostridia bacterium]